MLTDDVELIKTAMPKQVSPPAEEPVSLSEAKVFMHVEHDAEDSLINQLITAARQMAEAFLKSSLITQSWKIKFDNSAPAKIYLPMGPVQAVTSVTLIDAAGDSIAIAAANYYIDASLSNLISEVPLESKYIEIIYVAGFGAASNTPASIKHGILQHVAHMYENRGDGGTMPEYVMALYRPWVLMRVGL